ncbi:MAG: hypothetical protein AB2N28_4260 [Candidatus Phytoplasma solani]
MNQNIKNNNEKVNVFDVFVNYLLKHFDTDKYKITNMKINKLIYYIQGHYIAKCNKPLFKNLSKLGCLALLFLIFMGSF